jgi:hypothetical protein
MALTIETGAGVENADSYVAVADLDTFASERGFSDLPAVGADKEVLLRLAFDYVEAHRHQFEGHKTNEGNTYSQFPRCGLTIDQEDVDEDTVPVEVKRAQMQLAMDAVSEDLSPTGDGQVVIREKIDVIETQFDAGGSPAPQPIFAKADKWLAPLFRTGGGVNLIRV